MRHKNLFCGMVGFGFKTGLSMSFAVLLFSSNDRSLAFSLSLPFLR
jgi:hypothetical protein